MSNPIGNAFTDDSGSNGELSYSHQSGWMCRWIQPPSKQGTALIAPHSQTLCKDGLHHNPNRSCASLNITSDIPRSSELIRARKFRKQSSGNIPFCFPGPFTKGDNISAPTTLLDPSCSYEANSPSSRKRNRSSFEDDMVVTTHFSNDRKYDKYSAVLLHERNTFSAILSDDQKTPQSDARPLEGLPFSVRNVKTMRICTAGCSVGNLHEGLPLFSQSTTRNFLFTKGIVNEPTQDGGVKIQPLWSLTDSDKGDASTAKGDRGCELSAKTDTMDTFTLSNKNDISGVHSSPLVKLQQTVRDETIVTAIVDPMEDKIRGKMTVTEMADTSSMDGMEPSSSKTQSLEAEHLLCRTEQPSESKSIPLNKECSSQEASIRWVKRLKRSSSEVGESSAHEKTHHKELLISDQSMVNGESVSGEGNNAIFQCSWIRRWCQDHNVAKHMNLNTKGVVICKPDSSKLPFDELQKKQFPSIAAMAMMGKSMNGFRPCKYTKRGSLVVWKTDDY